jgi:hypothetical protein
MPGARAIATSSSLPATKTPGLSVRSRRADRFTTATASAFGAAGTRDPDNLGARNACFYKNV